MQKQYLLVEILGAGVSNDRRDVSEQVAYIPLIAIAFQRLNQKGLIDSNDSHDALASLGFEDKEIS